MAQRNNLEDEMAAHTTPMYRAPEMVDTWSNHPVDISGLVTDSFFVSFRFERAPFFTKKRSYLTTWCVIFLYKKNDHI